MSLCKCPGGTFEFMLFLYNKNTGNVEFAWDHPSSIVRHQHYIKLRSAEGRPEHLVIRKGSIIDGGIVIDTCAEYHHIIYRD